MFAPVPLSTVTSTTIAVSVTDGVGEPVGDGRVRFRHARALTPRDRDAVVVQVCQRALRWFDRSGLLDFDRTLEMSI